MKRTVFGFLTVLTIMSMMVGFARCASAPKTINYEVIALSELKQSMKNVKSSGQGFIVEGYFVKGYISPYIYIANTPTDNYKEGYSVKLHENLINQNRDLGRRIDPEKKYTFYISAYNKDNDFFVDKIEGLMTDDEVAAIEAQKEAEAEAKRIALEEANRYDPDKFTIVPSDFKPANYTSIDLFTAVANIEKMPSVGRNAGLLDLALTTRRYVSDVVFVSQNGTDILFRTDDNAISQYMKVDGRSGLTAGQKVRLYYVVTKHPLAEWRIVAIERL